MNDHDLIPGDKLLPHPSVLERIAFFDPAAPQAIMDRAQQLSEEGRHALPAQTPSAGRWQALLRGVSALFRVAARRSAPLPPAIAINRAWAAAGDDMRQAIAEYMDQKGLNPDKLGLRTDERQSLAPLLRPPQP